MLLIRPKVLQIVEPCYHTPFESMSMRQRHGGSLATFHGQEAGNLSWQAFRIVQGFVDVDLGGAFLGFEESCFLG